MIQSIGISKVQIFNLKEKYERGFYAACTAL